MSNAPLDEIQNRRIFHHLLGNTLIASIINFTVWFAITFYVYLQTLSVFATAIIAGIYLVVTASSGIWFGSLVDHNKKKTIMAISSAISLIIYTISFLVYILADPASFRDPTSVTLWIFVVLLMLGVIVGNIRTIALTTSVTFLIPEPKRDKANGLVGATAGVSFLITSVISGLMVGHSGMSWVLIMAIVVSLAAVVHLLFLKINEKGIVQGENEPQKVDLRGTYKVVKNVPGLLALILFATFNNFLGGVYMALLDPYGLSLVSVETWGFLWAFIGTGFILGGMAIAKFGLGKNPLRSLFLANITIWLISCLFTIQPWIVMLTIGMFIYMFVIPFIEAAEQTIIQKVVPPQRQGRVFGFAQSVEQAASPLTAFLIGPVAQFIFIPFMTTGAGVALLGEWFGTGSDRGIALLFTVTGTIGLAVTLLAMRSKYYRLLSKRYLMGE